MGARKTVLRQLIDEQEALERAVKMLRDDRRRLMDENSRLKKRLEDALRERDDVIALATKMGERR